MYQSCNFVRKTAEILKNNTVTIFSINSYSRIFYKKLNLRVRNLQKKYTEKGKNTPQRIIIKESAGTNPTQSYKDLRDLS